MFELLLNRYVDTVEQKIFTTTATRYHKYGANIMPCTKLQTCAP